MSTATRIAGLAGLAVLAACLIPAANAQTAPVPHRDRVLAVARQIMVAARYCTFVTIGAGGQPQARLVDPLEPDASLNVYVATNPLSRKVSEIAKDARVTLLYFDTKRLAYVTIIGRAVVVGGDEKAAHHKKDWQPFFALEKSGSYTLYRIDPARLEVMSAKDGLTGDPATWRPEIIEIK